MDIVEQLRKYECVCTHKQCRSCAAADEIEHLRAAIDMTLSAINEYHREVMGRMRRRWSTLFDALVKLEEARRG